MAFGDDSQVRLCHDGTGNLETNSAIAVTTWLEAATTRKPKT